jgi:Fe2+ or Zn2+ uptake regulation protein
MFSSDIFCVQLKAAGRRLTPQRRAIIQVLLADDGHATAEHVFNQVRAVMPDISPATVYNTLGELVEMGLLLELDLGLGERHYDVVTSDHAHVVCVGCGRIEDVPYDVAALSVSWEHLHGFEVIERQVIFRGYCPACVAQAGP